MSIDFQGADSTVVATGTTDVAAVDAAPGLRLLGFSVIESAGSPAAASINIHNGEDNTGPKVAVVKLAASENKNVWFGEPGVRCEDGIFVDRSGESTIVLYHKNN